MKNFEVHLKNEMHRERVLKRVKREGGSTLQRSSKRERRPEWPEFYTNGLPEESFFINDDDTPADQVWAHHFEGEEGTFVPAKAESDWD